MFKRLSFDELNSLIRDEKFKPTSYEWGELTKYIACIELSEEQKKMIKESFSYRISMPLSKE